jgi:N-acetylneuraminic acid mutarotase
VAGLLAALSCGVLLGTACSAASAQAGEWTWVGGSSTSGPNYTADGSTGNIYGQPGSYGKMGQFADGNHPGGRYGAANWTDSEGNEWVFGGYGSDSNGTQGYLNDLWEYSPTKNEWAWIGGAETVPGTWYSHAGVYPTKVGTFNSTNMPGSRQYAVTWTDSGGNLWMFGGLGYDSNDINGYLNDLWEYIPSKNQWGWMGGSSTVPGNDEGPSGIYPSTVGTTASTNVPGGRSEAAGWVDKDGNVWIYGGQGADSTGVVGWLNDLWKYDMTGGEWTWMGGSTTIGTNCSPLHSTYPTIIFCGQVASYGARGQLAASNNPGGRASAISFTDSQGNLWLFGGVVYFAAAKQSTLNDLWEYDTAKDEWAWMAGSNGASIGDGGNVPGVYGAKGTPATGNVPGGRYFSMGWVDLYDNVWVFGGQGVDSASAFGFVNDLWQYNPPTGEWTWWGGSSTIGKTACTNFGCGVPGVYPAKTGDTAAGNAPGSREFSNVWRDSAGDLWMFGGAGLDSTTSDYGILDDLWQFHTPTLAAAPTFGVPAGTYTSKASVTLSDTAKGATIYYTTNGATPTTASSVYKSAIGVTKSETIKALAVAAGYLESEISSATYTILPSQAAEPKFTPGEGTYTAHVPVTLSDGTPGAVIYYALHGAVPTSTSGTRYSSPISIDSTTTLKAIAIARGYSDSNVATSKYTIVRTQTIDFPRITGTHYAGKTLHLDAKASSGLAVSYASETPKVCTVSEATASLLAEGTCTIRATQAGNLYYAAAPPVTRSFPVAKSQ